MSPATPPYPERIPTAERVAFLRQPAAYQGGVRSVETRETRMSWVFLAGERVYKLKKPIRDRWLDFTTLAARQRNAHEEVRLNRRLAADVYLGTARLTVENKGALAIDGTGETIDWLVVMRRLPAERMLDRAISAHKVCASEVDRLADLLAEFYRQRAPATRSIDDHIGYFLDQQRVNHAIFADARVELAVGQYAGILDAIDRFLVDESDLLAKRVRNGHILEGHGDLRAEHICLEATPIIIDCLEFNRELRLVDPFDELADLALECSRLGAEWIGDTLQERCATVLDDRPPQRLLAFYTICRACLRARLALRHLLNPVVRTPGRWLPLAREYLERAESARLILAAPPAVRPATRPGGNDGSPPQTAAPH